MHWEKIFNRILRGVLATLNPDYAFDSSTRARARLFLDINLSHENKKALSPFDHKKIFLIVKERKTPYGCLTFIYYQKWFLW